MLQVRGYVKTLIAHLGREARATLGEENLGPLVVQSIFYQLNHQVQVRKEIEVSVEEF